MNCQQLSHMNLVLGLSLLIFLILIWQTFFRWVMPWKKFHFENSWKKGFEAISLCLLRKWFLFFKCLEFFLRVLLETSSYSNETFSYLYILQKSNSKLVAVLTRHGPYERSRVGCLMWQKRFPNFSDNFVTLWHVTCCWEFPSPREYFELWFSWKRDKKFWNFNSQPRKGLYKLFTPSLDILRAILGRKPFDKNWQLVI